MAFEMETGPENVVNIKVVGVGGAGNNLVSRVVRSGARGVGVVAVHTARGPAPIPRLARRPPRKAATS